MKPPKTAKTDFERIPKYDEWVNGTILEIEYDEKHKRSYQGEEKIGPCVRLKFGLEGCKFPHRSKWMTFNYGDKSNLYQKVLVPLVEDAKPDIDLDLDEIKGMKIKTMWSQDGEYDKLEMVRPIGDKFKINAIKIEVEEVPF